MCGASFELLHRAPQLLSEAVEIRLWITTLTIGDNMGF